MKPSAQPNLLHQIVLGALVKNQKTTRTEVRGRRSKTGWEEYTVEVPIPTIAGNVSDLNVERAAKRWVA